MASTSSLGPGWPAQAVSSSLYAATPTPAENYPHNSSGLWRLHRGATGNPPNSQQGDLKANHEWKCHHVDSISCLVLN